MKMLNTISSLILILIGVVFCYSSLELGLGRMYNPGPGLVPFLTGGLLVLLSVGVIIQVRFGKELESKVKLFGGKHWGVALWILISLFTYALILDILGFILTTFLILIFLFKISEKQSWKLALGMSLIVIIFTYFLFDYLLKISFPRGILGL